MKEITITEEQYEEYLELKLRLKMLKARLKKNQYFDGNDAREIFDITDGYFGEIKLMGEE